jgi:hypothetical protein
MPYAGIGGVIDAKAVSRQGKPTRTLGLANIGALLSSSCFRPLKPTCARAGLSVGSHPNSSPKVTKPIWRYSPGGAGGCRPLKMVADVKYFIAHPSGLSKSLCWTGAMTVV